MTARWICRPCDMLCLGQEHYARHYAGDHSPTTAAERTRWWAVWNNQHETRRHRNVSNDLKDVLAGRAFKSVQPQSNDDSSERITLEVGDQFVGTLAKRVEFDSKYQPGKKVEAYELTALNGDKKFLIGKGNMKHQMSPVRDGQLVRITRLPDEDFEKNGTTMTSSSWGIEVAE